jgi:hypothetical protein
MVAEGIAAILPHALACRVPLAIEPLHPMYAADRACVNTLRQALDVCDVLGPGVGVAIDVYHVCWDPEVGRQIARAGAAGRILAHHICDWLVPTRDILLDRGMMGDGIINLKGCAPRSKRLFRPARGRDFLGRDLVKAAGPAGSLHLHRSVPQRLLNRARQRSRRLARRFSNPSLLAFALAGEDASLYWSDK